jgi:hypothetical protein
VSWTLCRDTAGISRVALVGRHHRLARLGRLIDSSTNQEFGGSLQQCQGSVDMDITAEV